MMAKYLSSFLIFFQNRINYGQTTKVFLENRQETLLINYILQGVGSPKEDNKKKTLDKRPKRLSKDSIDNFIVALLNESIIREEYHISFECTKVFQSQITKLKYFPVFNMFIEQFKTDYSKYEIKLALLR